VHFDVGGFNQIGTKRREHIHNNESLNEMVEPALRKQSPPRLSHDLLILSHSREARVFT
nr:hypothetical protein [Tanacetum cinerariifolium]